jgi:hypothetical protein
MNVTKFTLSSGKVIYLREPTIGDTETAAKIAGKKAGSDNQIYLGVILQKEMLKLLLVSIDDKKLNLTDKELIEKLLTYKEYNQSLKAVQMVLADDEEGNGALIPEFTTIGDK